MLTSSDEMTADRLEQELIQIESLVGRLRARQVGLIRSADASQVPFGDGARSLKEWVAGRLDVHPATASELAHMAKSEPADIEAALADGDMSFDRAAVTSRLSNAGADADTLERSQGVAVHLVGKLIARQARLDPVAETEVFERRRVWLQPNLDNTLMTGTMTLAGTDAELLLAALDGRADELCDRLDGHRPRLEQRRADALVSFATDHAYGDGPRRPKAHIFIDADKAAATNGESGGATRTGIGVGSNTLEEILCVGTTQVTMVDTDGLTPLPTTGPTLHPRIRDYVFQRDGGCTADGCTSTYRLEPHHIRERSQGGDHHPDNLTLLCWFHHHVVIHQRGFRLDPESTPGRRRFIRPSRPTRPPPDS